MFTRCRHCDTWFAIGADALRQGRGEVRCGSCLQTFDALAELCEELPAAPVAGAPVSLREGPAPEPETEPQPEPESGPQSEPRSGLGAPPAHPHPLGRPKPPRIGPELGDFSLVGPRPEAAPGPVRGEPGRPRRATGAETDAGAAGPPLRPIAGPDIAVAGWSEEPGRVTELLRTDFERRVDARRRARARVLRWLLALALLATLAGQYVWFNPEDVARRYPQAKGWVAGFCRAARCAFAEPRDPQRIELASRDVRVHPRYEGALLITASLVNTAAYAQPFPQLEFTLFDVSGRSIAGRRFAPTEYLDEEVDTAAGMQPGQPVQIVLELVAPEEAAVSFEFQFH